MGVPPDHPKLDLFFGFPIFRNPHIWLYGNETMIFSACFSSILARPRAESPLFWSQSTQPVDLENGKHESDWPKSSQQCGRLPPAASGPCFTTVRFCTKIDVALWCVWMSLKHKIKRLTVIGMVASAAFWVHESSCRLQVVQAFSDFIAFRMVT